METSVSSDDEWPAAEPGEDPAGQLHAPWHFWPALLASATAFAALTWVLDGLPAQNEEGLVLRWLRALAQHPVRGPVGLALVIVGTRQLVKAVSRSADRA